MEGQKELKNKKRIWIFVIATVAVVLIAGFLILAINLGWLGGKSGKSSADKVYVERVGDLTGSNTGAVSSYAGKVETQESKDINKDSDKEIKEVYVEVGQEVKTGDPLFSYDTDSIQQQIQTAELDIEGYGYSIDSYNSQIADLTKEKASAPADQKYEYSMQIAQLQAQLQQAQYDKQTKQNELDNLKKSLENTTVTSPMDGVVKTINNTDASIDDGTSGAFMTLLAIGDYRVKGSIDEQSYYYGNLSVGQAVIVRSRVDETQTWTGTISSIDTESTSTDESSSMYYYYDDSSSGESATKYPFYVQLDSSDGLILGQHVFIEPDLGQVYEEQEGIWLDEGYIDFADDGYSYVWVANKKNKLEHRKVVLGEENADTYQYQILDGLTEDDYIAYNMEGLYEGITCVTNYEDVDYSSPLYNQDTTDDSDDGSSDDYYDEGYYEEEYYDDTYYEEDTSVDETGTESADYVDTESGEEVSE